MPKYVHKWSTIRSASHSLPNCFCSSLTFLCSTSLFWCFSWNPVWHFSIGEKWPLGVGAGPGRWCKQCSVFTIDCCFSGGHLLKMSLVLCSVQMPWLRVPVGVHPSWVEQWSAAMYKELDQFVQEAEAIYIGHARVGHFFGNCEDRALPDLGRALRPRGGLLVHSEGPLEPRKGPLKPIERGPLGPRKALLNMERALLNIERIPWNVNMALSNPEWPLGARESLLKPIKGPLRSREGPFKPEDVPPRIWEDLMTYREDLVPREGALEPRRDLSWY